MSGRRYARPMRAKHPGTCERCEQPIRILDMIVFDLRARRTVHADCENPRGIGDPGGLPQ